MSIAHNRRRRLRRLFEEGSELSLHDIMQRLDGLSERHVRRLLEELRADGLPIEAEFRDRRKVFRLPPEHRIIEVPPLRLTEDQTLALAVAADASRAALAPTPLGPALESAFTGLLDHLQGSVHAFDLADEREHWHFGAGAAAAIDPVIFTAIAAAIRDRIRVRIEYVTASTGERSVDRAIDPYALAVRGGSWLVVAYCHKRKAVRDFSLAGITRAVPADPKVDHGAVFEVPEWFDVSTYFSERFNALAGDAVRTVRLLVDGEHAPYFKRKRYHTSQTIEEERADGRLVVRFEVSGLEEMRSFAGGWGAGVTVLEPPELAAMMRHEAEEVVRMYGGGMPGRHQT